MSKRSHLEPCDKAEVRAAIHALASLRSDMLLQEARFSRQTRELRANQRSSATNLIHYVALRDHDLRKLQKRLTDIGVSSLGRSEGHILDDINRVLGILHRLERSSSALPVPGRHGGRCQSLRGP
jgi:pyruvate kinase